MIKSETFLDKKRTILNGLVCIYNIAGNLDSVGNYVNGKKQGSFFKLRSYGEDDIKYIRRYDYDQDILENIVELLSQTPVLNESSSDSVTGNRFPGGIKKWKDYLANAIKYPTRAKEDKITGEVRVNFIVDGNGDVHIAYILKSKEYSLDQESIRVIRDSGKWLIQKNEGIPSNIYLSQRFEYNIN
jgi:TonB family protein